MDKENNQYETVNSTFEISPYIHLFLFIPLSFACFFILMLLISKPPIFVLIPALAIIAGVVFPLATQLSLFYRYIGGTVVGKYIEKGDYFHSPWTYYVQVDDGRWVEEFRVQFDVYRMLSAGDTYLGMGSHKYDVEAYNVSDVMESRRLFEDLLELSIDKSVPDAPFIVTLVDTKRSRSSKRKTSTYYNHYDVRDNI